MDKKLKLHIKDKTFAHCEFSNNPLPPKQVSKYITWVRDVEPSADDWCVYTDLCVQEVRPGNKNIVWLIEPYDHIPHIYNWVEKNQNRFEKIWSHDKQFISQTNGTLIPFGGCWIDDFDQGIHKKTKDFSIIASGKRQHQGHKLRHSIIASAGGKIVTFGNGYNPIKDKIEGLREYRYHFVVENVREDFWFTEKLIDCFITGTVPIFWGCPSIDKFFDTRGMKIFEKLADLPSLLKECTKKEYLKMMPYIEGNLELAKNYILAEDNIYKLLCNNLDKPLLVSKK